MTPPRIVLLALCAVLVVIGLGSWIVNGELDFGLGLLGFAVFVALMTLLGAWLEARRRNVES